MPATSELRFIGTGKPARANVNPRISREETRKSIRVTGVVTQQDFRATIQSELLPSIRELGRGAVKIINGTGIYLTA